jgi:hypothetical protein
VPITTQPQGEISFQLFNLNSIPSTVVDPRPLRLKQFERRAKVRLHSTAGWHPWLRSIFQH